MAADADQLRAGPGGTSHPGPALLGVFTTPALRTLSGIYGTTWGVNANLGFEF